MLAIPRLRTTAGHISNIVDTNYVDKFDKVIEKKKICWYRELNSLLRMYYDLNVQRGNMYLPIYTIH